MVQFVLTIILSIFAPPAYAANLAIKIPEYAVKSNTSNFSDVAAPSEDLVYQGQVISPETAFALLKKGVNISTLDPQPNDIWAPKKLELQGDSSFPQDGGEVRFVSTLRIVDRLSGMYRAAVESADGRNFNLAVSLDVHGVLLRAALLRKLGYPVDLPKYYRTIKIRFETAKERELFILNLGYQTVTEDKRFIVEKSADGLSLTLRDLILEKGRVLVPQYHWGVIDPESVRGRRALRGLIVPLVLGDAGESINKFSWEPGRAFNNKVVLAHPYADFFYSAAYEDARWAALKMANLSLQDFDEVVAFGSFPQDVGALVKEKLISRRNDLLKLFSVSSETWPFNSKLTVGSVEDGKVTKLEYEGYGVHFSHENVLSPLRLSEMLRFGKLEVLGKALEKGLEYINKVLPNRSIDEVFQAHQQDLFKKFLDHLDKTGGAQPFEIPMGVWGGPIGSLTANASRNVVSGTYYGVDSKVQLVDSIGVRGMVGFFAGFDGIKNLVPSGSANLAVTRNWLHVRPVNSITAADKASWKNLLVPKFMRDLVKGFEDNATPEQMEADLEAFLTNLKEGEIFTIVDSVSLGAAARVNIPVMQLLGLDPGVSASVGIGSGFNHVVLARTTFRRVPEGFQVYLQSIDINDFDKNLDVNYWMNILRLGHTNRWGHAQTQFFDIKTEKRTQEERLKAVLVIRSLMKSGSTAILKDKFSPFELDHKVKDKINRASFLFRKWDKLEESHVVKVRPPAQNGIDPANHERTLGSFRIVRRAGNNFFDFVSDVIDGFFPGWGPGSSTPGGDPGATPFGKSKWVTTRVEAELTQDRRTEPMATVETLWTGWSLSRKQLLSMVEKLEARVVSFGGKLVNKDVFSQTDNMKLYEVKGSLTIYQKGFQNIQVALIDEPSEQQIYFRMVSLVGETKFREWCDFVRKASPNSGIEKYYGIEREYSCAQPWMKDILDMRKKSNKTLDDVGHLKRMAKVIDLLQRNVDWNQWLPLVGVDQFFYLIQVSGFRSKDETGMDEYTSSSVGSWDPKLGRGIFAEFISKYGIMGHEMNASYFGEGF